MYHVEETSEERSGTAELQAHPKSQVLAIVLTFVVCVAAFFIGGYYLRDLSANERELSDNERPMPSRDVDDLGQVIANTVIIPGKEYYDDTIMAISTTEPRRFLVGTVTRLETEGGANQNTRVSYFDGEKWTRKLAAKSYEDTGIHSNEILRDWTISIDPSRVLKQAVTGRLTIGSDEVGFETGVITNNLGIRSLPGYTKFMSTGEGKLFVNGQSEAAKILYTRIYSNNMKEMQFYETPFGLTTHWLAFWDQEGNIYHVDSTNVTKPTDKYQTHQFGVLVDKAGRVSKTFEVKIDMSGEKPPQTYQIQLGSPINKTLSFKIDKSINKAPNNEYDWFMSNGSGEVDGKAGYGVVEYIHN